MSHSLDCNIIHQPNFPVEDLMETNERMLFGALAHQEIREENYRAATKSQSFFRAADNLLDMFERRRVLNDELARGFILGAQSMIAMCHLVNPQLEFQHKLPDTTSVHEVLSKDVMRVVTCLGNHAVITTKETPLITSSLEGVMRREGARKDAVLAGAGIVRHLGKNMLELTA